MPAIDPLAGRLITKLTLKALENPDKKVSEQEYENIKKEISIEASPILGSVTPWYEKILPIPTWVEFHEIQNQVNDGADLSLEDLYQTLHLKIHSEKPKEAFSLDLLLRLAVSAKLHNLASVLVKKGANINHKDKAGDTALHQAAITGNVDTIKRFIELGSNIDEPNKNGKTPLFEAAHFGNLEAVEFLIAQKANINHKDKEGNTLLHHAAQSRNFDIVKRAIEKGLAVDAPNSDEETAIFYALHSPRIMDFLILQKANIHHKDKRGNSVLHKAAYAGNLEILKTLVKLGLNPEETNSQGETPIFEAIYSGSENINYLISQGASINHKNKWGETVLNKTAADWKDLKTLKTLVELGLNIDEPNNYGKTPLHTATHYKNFEIVNFLLEQKANIHHKDPKGITLLHEAVDAENLDLIKSLIALGIKVDEPNSDGITALLYAAYKGNVRIIDFLLTQKANIHHQDTDGNGILYHATNSNNLDTIKSLISLGIKVDLPNKLGITPLLNASSNGHLHIVKYLLKQNVNIYHKDFYGRTILHHATYDGDLETVKFLVGQGIKIDTPHLGDLTAFEICKVGKEAFPYLLSKSLPKNFKSSWVNQIYFNQLIIHSNREFIKQLDFLRNTLQCSEIEIASFLNNEISIMTLLKNKESYLKTPASILKGTQHLLALQQTNQTLGKNSDQALNDFVSFFSNKLIDMNSKSNLQTMACKMAFYQELQKYIPEKQNEFSKWLKIEVPQVKTWSKIDFTKHLELLPYLLNALKLFKDTQSEISKLREKIKVLNFKTLISDKSLDDNARFALLGMVFELNLEKEKLKEFLEHFKINFTNLKSVENIRIQLVKHNPALGNRVIEKLVGQYLEESINQANLNEKIKFCNIWGNPEDHIENEYLDDIKDVYCNQAAFMKNKIKQYLEQTPTAAIALQKQYPDFFSANDWFLFDQLSRQVKKNKVADSAITKKEKLVIQPEKTIETIKEVAETKSKNAISSPDKLKLLLSQSITIKSEENILNSIEKKVKEAHKIKDDAGLQERINFAFIASGISNRVQGEAMLLFLARQVAEYLDDKPSDKYEELKFNWGNETLSLKTILETKMGLSWEENKSGTLQKGKKVVTRLLQGNTQVLTRAYDTLTASKLENFKKDYQKVLSIPYQGEDKTQKDIAISSKVDGYSITQENGGRVGFVIAANAQNAKMDYLTQLGKHKGDLSANFKKMYGNKLVFDGVGAMMSGSTPVVSIIEKGKPLNKTSTLEGRMQGLVLMNAQGQPILLDKTNLSIAELNNIGMVKPYAAQLKKDFDALEKQLLKVAESIQTGEKSEVEALQKKHAGLIKEYLVLEKKINLAKELFSKSSNKIDYLNQYEHAQMFWEMIKQSQCSGWMGTLIVKNGTAEKVNGSSADHRRVLIQLSDGRFGVFSSEHMLTMPELTKLLDEIKLDGATVKMAINLDTGMYDSATLYDKDGVPHIVGHNDGSKGSNRFVIVAK